MNKLLCTLIFSILSLLSIAQNIEIGGALGFSSYQGDVTSNKVWSFDEINPGINAYARIHSNSPLAFKATFLLTQLEGFDNKHFGESEWRRRRNASFKTIFQEISMRMEWDFLYTKNDVRFFHPYLFLGGGILFAQNINTQNVRGNEATEKVLQTKKNNQVFLSFPVGIGFYFDGHNGMTIGLELTNGVLFNDELDGISPEGFSDGNDWYNFLALNIGFKLGKDSSKERRNLF